MYRYGKFVFYNLYTRLTAHRKKPTIFRVANDNERDTHIYIAETYYCLCRAQAYLSVSIAFGQNNNKPFDFYKQLCECIYHMSTHTHELKRN